MASFASIFPSKSASGMSFLTASKSQGKDASAGDKKAVAVQPHELTSAMRLPDKRRLLGRVVRVDQTDTVFTCYLVCGPTRKQVIQVEAWRELKQPAMEKLQEGMLVSLTNVALSLRRADKMKYSYSGVQLLVRFDNKLEVHCADDETQRPVSGFPELQVGTLCEDIPFTPFLVAACLREGIVRIKGVVMEMHTSTGKSATDFGKAVLEEFGEDGIRLHAELVGFGEFATWISDLEKGETYEFMGIAILAANDKNGFSFKWQKGASKTKIKLENNANVVTRSGEIKMLSNWAPGSGSQSATRPILVTAATLESIVPSNGAHKFDNDVSWEIPWITLTDISRRNNDEWHYVGCSECFKSACTQNHGSSRNCYAVDIQFVDHTSLLEAKLFTSAADDLFAAGGVDQPGGLKPEDQLQMLQTLRDMNFSIRLSIREDDAYGNRPARNSLQVVRIRKQDAAWTGTAKPWLRMPCAFQKCVGLPAVFVKEVRVDAADQVQLPGNIFVDTVELLVRIGQEKPQNHQQEDEAGLRLTVKAFDHGDKDSSLSILLMWVVSIEALLDLARELLANTVLRIIARPVVVTGKIIAWQVLHHSSNVDTTAWLERLQWQRADMEQKGSKKRPMLEAFSEKTPNSKVKLLKDTLESPSYTAP